jgi:hypothetical protein
MNPRPSSRSATRTTPAERWRTRARRAGWARRRPRGARRGRLSSSYRSPATRAASRPSAVRPDTPCTSRERREDVRLEVLEQPGVVAELWPLAVPATVGREPVIEPGRVSGSHRLGVWHDAGGADVYTKPLETSSLASASSSTSGIRQGVRRGRNRHHRAGIWKPCRGHDSVFRELFDLLSTNRDAPRAGGDERWAQPPFCAQTHRKRPEIACI